MKNSSSEVNIGCSGFLTLLALIFITLKLTHYIDWPWFWILSPILIPFGIATIVLLIIGIGYLIHNNSKNK